MEEEWMRDRALLRDLLQKTPHASPRELVQATGRSLSWVKKWHKRVREGDPTDPRLMCSRSRAHHAPYFRWNPRVETRIVEMRLSPPEHLGRTPGPRALFYYLPRDPVLQAAEETTAHGASEAIGRDSIGLIIFFRTIFPAKVQVRSGRG